MRWSDYCVKINLNWIECIIFLDEYYALCGIVEPTKPTGPGGGTPFPPGGTPGMVPITGKISPIL
jgi:hypothetical protein